MYHKSNPFRQYVFRSSEIICREMDGKGVIYGNRNEEKEQDYGDIF